MAKQKPSGDPVPNEPGALGVTATSQPLVIGDGELEVLDTTAPAPVADVAPLVLPEGHVWIDLLDANGTIYDRQSVPSGDAIFQINLNGQWYRHVSTAPDGVWGYMV